MNIHPTALPGVLLLEPKVFADERGFFIETWNAERFAAAGLDATFVQDNHSRSAAGTVRGLHYQLKRPQGKLVRVLDGEILDVALDIRIGSPTFGQHAVMRLSGDNHHQAWVPAGFAHGFQVLSRTADVAYKCTDVYAPRDEYSIRFDDPALGIGWQPGTHLVSPRDRDAPCLAAAAGNLPHYTADGS